VKIGCPVKSRVGVLCDEQVVVAIDPRLEVVARLARCER
jgi:hypothetical protein